MLACLNYRITICGIKKVQEAGVKKQLVQQIFLLKLQTINRLSPIVAEDVSLNVRRTKQMEYVMSRGKSMSFREHNFVVAKWMLFIEKAYLPMLYPCLTE